MTTKEIAQEIRYYSNPDNDRFGKGFGVCDIAELVERPYSVVRKIAEQNNIKLHYVKPPQPIEDLCLNKWGERLETFLKMRYLYYTETELAIMLETNVATIDNWLGEYGLTDKRKKSIFLKLRDRK